MTDSALPPHDTPERERARVLLEARRVLREEEARIRKRRTLERKLSPQVPIRRASYWQFIGPPPSCGPADYARALGFSVSVHEALDQGGWSDKERSSLYRLGRTWSARAAGEDIRFNLLGNRPGRVSAEVQEKLDAPT
jgi:hypothetical protein